ncbi:MAG: flavodoxin family protein [Ruminococcus sp.]|nr:flavodoxin family protein [Ruminococcus sp.]
MKTLIINGSPRKNGHTAGLVRQFISHLTGEYQIVDAYRSAVSPCVDCRYCWHGQGCSIQDEMQKIYPYLQECDNILIASPIYFSELTGKVLDFGSRLQTYYCAEKFQKKQIFRKSKKGAVILVGGGSGSSDKAYSTARILLHHMNCRQIHELVYCPDTDNIPALENEAVLSGLHSILHFFANEK